MSEILRVALLGGGKMALQHAAAIRQCRNARLVAVVDPHITADELKTRFGGEVVPFDDVRTMLEAVRPDVVHVVTPPHTHTTLARQCLTAGAHVYVEKPFALMTTDAEAVLRLADESGRMVCAAHQVLFQEAGSKYHVHLPMIGEIVHVESFFSFRPVRRRAGGGGLNTPVEQLIDILPHPVYLLLDALRAANGGPTVVTSLDVSIDGDIRAVIRRGNAMASLVVSLRARPVESWLRLMGTNGMVEADFILGNVVRHPGPGASAISVVLKPFSRAWQIGWGSFKSVVKLVFRRHKSYPGLAELLESFYRSIRDCSAPPIPPAQILDTVRICQAISDRLHADERAADERAAQTLRGQEAQLPPLNDRGVVLLTGGTGMLGRRAARLLREAGWRIRVPVRRNVPPNQRIAGIEYALADLSGLVPDSLMHGVESVLHLAAETAGSAADHQRNTVIATRNLIDAMKRSSVRRLVNVSSVAVLKPSRFGRPLHEDSPVDRGNLQRGPYVYAKAEAEYMAKEAEQSGDIDVRNLRLGPLVDLEDFQAPGRLGREIGRLFVAMGRPATRIAVCTIESASSALRYFADSFEIAPHCVNLLDSPAPTRGDLVKLLVRQRPDLLVVWMPLWVLGCISVLTRLFFKLDLYAAFKSERYSSEATSAVAAAARSTVRR